MHVMTHLLENVHASWLPVLEPQSKKIFEIASALDQLIASGRTIAPASNSIFRALESPLDSVSVIIVGQDPYPTHGHAVGWAFSTPQDLRPLPRSLRNIFTELESDLSCPTPPSGDLSGWVKQGVFLLNRSLTVEVGVTASHKHLGWQTLTDAITQALVERERPLVAILWGNDAQQLSRLFKPGMVIASAHPSPLSAWRGFFGSKPFSRANRSLVAQGAKPIEWCLP